MEVGSSVYVVGVVSGSKGAGEMAGCTTDDMNVVALDLSHDIVDWDLVEDTSNLFRGLDPVLVLYPCPFVLGDDIHVRGNLDVAGGEVVVGTVAD